jgi:hypothetical protein
MVGEHIRTRRDGRWTHGIDCGDATVIHLARNGEGAARVLRTYRLEFVAGADAVEVVTHRERTFAANEIVARAYSRFSLAALAAMFHDSESFAEWCATGRLPPVPQNAPNAVDRRASARAAPKPAPPRAAARAKARPASGAKRPAARPGPKRKARASAIRKAAPKRAARRTAAPSRRKATKRGAKARRGRR